MSSVSSRPRVRSISSAVLEAAAIGCVQAIGSLVTAAIRSLDAASRDAYLRSAQSIPAKSIPAILPISSIRAQMPVVERGICKELAPHKLPSVESAKLTTLLKLQTVPYICDSAVLRAPLEALVTAGTEAEAGKASRRLMQALEAGHHQVLARALVTACRNASVEAGFECVETTPGIDGSIRVIASDKNGRALVTEIHADRDREPSIETEVVGVSDGSCVGILDRFDRALEEQGVRAGASDRKWTGGVCELHAAKEFLKRKVQPRLARPAATTPTTAGKHGEGLSRSRKLNHRIRQHIR